MICPVCKQPVSGGKTYRKQQYHHECFQKKIEAAKAKDAKKAVISADPDMVALRNYLLQLFDLSQLTPLLQKQLDTYAKDYSFAEILYCLRYFYELEESDAEYDGEPTIGIVPYIYNEAMQYKQTIEEAKKANAAFAQSEDERVYVRPQKSFYKPLGYHMEDL